MNTSDIVNKFDKVKFTKPQNNIEADQRFIVMEDRDERIAVLDYEWALFNLNMPIKPIEVYYKWELELV